MQLFGTQTALFVNQTAALLLSIGKSLVGVFYSKSDVVHTSTAAIFFDELGHGALRTGGEQELDFGLAAFQKSGLDFLVGNFFNCIALQAHDILPILEGFVEVCHSNSDVFNMRRCHFEKI